MNHIAELFKILPILESAMSGGLIGDIESIISQIEQIIADLKALNAHAAPVAPETK